MLDQHFVAGKQRFTLLVQYGSVLRGYGAAIVLYLLVLLLVFASPVLPALWPFALTLLKAIYILATPMYMLATPIAWIVYQFLPNNGFILLLPLSLLLLTGFAWFLQVFRSQKLQMALAFCLGLLILAALALVTVQFYGPVYVDELF